MAEIAPPKRLVEHMERAGFVVIRPQAMKPPPEVRSDGASFVPTSFGRERAVSPASGFAVSLGKAPTDSMTPTTKLAHPFPIASRKRGGELTAIQFRRH